MEYQRNFVALEGAIPSWFWGLMPNDLIADPKALDNYFLTLLEVSYFSLHAELHLEDAPKI